MIEMKRCLLIVFCFLLGHICFAQARIDGAAGRTRGFSKYTANTQQLSLYGTTSLEFPRRIGGGIGYNFVLRNQNLTTINLLYYYNATTETETENMYDISGSYGWKFFDIGSSFRTFFGTGIDVGISSQESLIFDKQLTLITYGIHAFLECDYLISDVFGLFVSAKEEMRCMERIVDIRFRYFITAGIKIGL
jgi:hypothetical protein